MTADPSAAGPARSGKLDILIVFLLCAVFLAQCAWFITTQSLTFDEPYHVTAGMEVWRYGRFERFNDHPPLSRLLFTIPVMTGDWWMDLAEDDPVWSVRPDPESLAWRVRGANALLGVALGLLLWSVARRLFSTGAAHFALALFVLSPAVIAHFSLATTDGIGTLMVFATAVQVERWRRSPVRRETVLLGVVLGWLLVSKFYTLPIYTLAVALVLVLGAGRVEWRPANWNWGKAVLCVGVSLLVVWGMYRFHVSRITLDGERAIVTLPNASSPINENVDSPIRATFYFPAGEFFVGLGTVVHHNMRGHSSYFLGELSETGGWKLYFPVAVILKWPTVPIAVFATALLLAWRRRISLPAELRLLSLFPVVFFVLAVYSRINIGDRHILPVYPFVLLVAGGIWHWVRGRGARKAVLVAALAVMAADVGRYAPDYLSYFNVFMQPEESWRLYGDSSVDWGQGLLALREYERQHPGERFHLAYYGNVEPVVYGIRARPLGEGQRVSGTVVVSAVRLAGRRLKDPSAYHWLLNYPRKALLNHTLHVFEVPEAAKPEE